MESKIADPSVSIIGGDYEVTRCRLSLVKLSDEYVVVVFAGPNEYFVVKAGEEYNKALATLNNVASSFCHVAKRGADYMLNEQTGERTPI